MKKIRNEKLHVIACNIPQKPFCNSTDEKLDIFEKHPQADHNMK